MKKGQNVIAGLLYFFMSVVIVALLMPTVRTFIGMGVNATNGTTHGIFLRLIFNYFPVYFVILMLIILIIILRSR